MSALAHSLRALQSRNYRLFFAGQTVSLIGTWMTRLATSWLVYRLTGSAVLLGMVSFCSQIPMFFLAPDRGRLGGPLGPAANAGRHAGPLHAAIAGARGADARGRDSRLAHRRAGAGCRASSMPSTCRRARAFVVQMVEHREDLSNAIALNSSMVNATRLIGPAIAGIVIGAIGEGWCFLMDGVSYIAVIASLLAMRIGRRGARPRRRARSSSCARAGTTCGSRRRSARCCCCSRLVSLVGMPYTVLMPIFAGPHSARRAAHAGLPDGARRASARLLAARAARAAARRSRAWVVDPCRPRRCSASRPDRLRALTHVVAVAR